jgi:hypothetical protein
LLKIQEIIDHIEGTIANKEDLEEFYQTYKNETLDAKIEALEKIKKKAENEPFSFEEVEIHYAHLRKKPHNKNEFLKKIEFAINFINSIKNHKLQELQNNYDLILKELKRIKNRIIEYVSDVTQSSKMNTVKGSGQIFFQRRS